MPDTPGMREPIVRAREVGARKTSDVGKPAIPVVSPVEISPANTPLVVETGVVETGVVGAGVVGAGVVVGVIVIKFVEAKSVAVVIVVMVAFDVPSLIPSDSGVSVVKGMLSLLMPSVVRIVILVV